MGRYLNSSTSYVLYKNETMKPYFVDKTKLLSELFPFLEVGNTHICITRPRRFGKTMIANMIASFLGKRKSENGLFESLNISQNKEYIKYKNQYDVIFIDFSKMPRECHSYREYIDRIEENLIRDLKKAYPDIEIYEGDSAADVLETIFEEYDEQRFIFVFDEWDFIFHKDFIKEEDKKQYILFLSNLLKDRPYVIMTYMTGILPIKKYGTHSALNMFDEFSMIDPGPLACYVGFTEKEVEKLCKQYGMDMEEVKNWYDGYSFDGVPSVYSPRSVVNSMRFQKISNYWNQTETFEALQVYIDMNFEHLKDDVLSMIAGESVAVNTESFTNDMETFRTEDDVLTLLIHLGYLAYDDKTKTVKIPNSEIRAEYVNTVSVSDWGSVSKALKDSADTLNAIWQGREEQVAKVIEQAHFETSHIQYNDENALSYTISLALYAARNFYTIHRELAGGKGFADLVFIPKKQFAEKPALVVELKWDKSAEGAIKQIKDKKYFESLEEYKNNMLLVGINYDRKTKTHECKIEKLK